MRLIQEEFAFDGYLDNGLEALIMGMKATGASLEAQDKGEVEGGGPKSISLEGTQGSTHLSCWSQSGQTRAAYSLYHEGRESWGLYPSDPKALRLPPSDPVQGNQKAYLYNLSHPLQTRGVYLRLERPHFCHFLWCHI